MSSKAENDPMLTDYREKCENGITTSYVTRSTVLPSNASQSAKAEKSNILEAAATMLSQVDFESYEAAVLVDSYTMMVNQTFSKSFPWHKPGAFLLQTLPRDIEEMAGILHAGQQHSAFGVDKGEFGYGSFDQGGISKTDFSENSKLMVPPVKKAQDDSASSLIPKKSQREEEPIESCEDLLASSGTFRAAARRSEDPGVIELIVALPPPASLESALVSCQMNGILPKEPWLRFDKKGIQKAKAMVEAERADTSSYMPLHWDKIDQASPFNPPAFIKSCEEKYPADTGLVDKGEMTTEVALVHHAKAENKRHLEYNALVQSCTRKWNISVRVKGVSSRTSLFDTVNGGIDSTKIKPVYCHAIFPMTVQIGQCVSLETAMQMDNDGLASSLDSYDCRAFATNPSLSFQAMEDVTKKDTPGRAKKINVGRTRLIWSGIQYGNNSKLSYISLTSGQKLDSAAYKRPREAKVAVSLNGNLLEMPSMEKRSPSKKKPYQTNFSDEPASPEQVYNAFSGNIAMVEDSIKNATNQVCIQNRGRKIGSKRNYSQIDGENVMCLLDGEAYTKIMAKKPKFSKSSMLQKDNQFTHMKYGGTSILKYIPPHLSCLPLDDGFVRTFCELHGDLQATSVHHLLNLAARNYSKGEILCTICWTGSSSDSVLECLNCDLLAHSSCCYDQGNFISEAEVTAEERSVLQARGKTGKIKLWRCSVCQNSLTPMCRPQTSHDTVGISLGGSRKSLRTLKTPARFNDETDIDNNSFLRKKKPRKPRPSPKCIYCPHSGGSMSILSKDNWVHDICRIWCTTPRRQKSKLEKTPAGSLRSMFNDPIPQKDMVCAICGTGEIAYEPKDQNNSVQDEVIKNSRQKSDENCTGLIRCAAVGCSVMFHPMCATIVTRLISKSYGGKDDRNNHDGHNLTNKKSIDRNLCQKFTLGMMEITREEGCYGSLSGDEKSSIIPVGFCGIHNHQREPSFYGSDPAADRLSSLIRIPFQ